MNLDGKGCLNCSPGPIHAGSAEHNPSSILKQVRTASVQKQKARVEEAGRPSITEGFLAIRRSRQLWRQPYQGGAEEPRAAQVHVLTLEARGSHRDARGKVRVLCLIARKSLSMGSAERTEMWQMRPEKGSHCPQRQHALPLLSVAPSGKPSPCTPFAGSATELALLLCSVPKLLGVGSQAREVSGLSLRKSPGKNVKLTESRHSKTVPVPSMARRNCVWYLIVRILFRPIRQPMPLKTRS